MTTDAVADVEKAEEETKEDINIEHNLTMTIDHPHPLHGETDDKMMLYVGY